MIRSLLLALVLSLVPAAVQAQALAGALNGSVVIADRDVGGALWADLWASFDWFRVGGFAGVAIIPAPASRDAYNRNATPLGVSLAAVANLGDVDLELRLRGGLWAGATQDAKMTVGGFLGGGAFLDFHLGGGASLGGGIEVWGFLGAGETWAVAPTITLTFGPPPAAPVDLGTVSSGSSFTP